MIDATDIISAIGAIAAIIAAIASTKALHPRAKPVLEDPTVSLAIHHANTRRCSGSFLAKNGGPRTYEIVGLALYSDGIELPQYNLVAINQWPGEGVGKNGAQKLPLAVDGYTSKQVFFHTEELPTKYEGELPSNVTLEVRLDCRSRVITEKLKRDGNTHHYRI